MNLDLAAPFLIGLLGSLHCLGMCGPLVLAYSLHLKPSISKGTPLDPNSDPRMQGREKPIPSFWSGGFFHHLAYHFGRVTTYGILGGLAAGFFNHLGLNLFLPVRGGLILIGGAVITILGLVLLRVIPLPTFLNGFSLPTRSLGERLLPSLIQSPVLFSKMALGSACGLLPCGLSSSILVKAAISENMAQGFLTMTAFGLGTIPALLAIGFPVSLLSLRTRIIGERLAALSVVAMGLILIVKGVKLLV
jgi:sulfite exporter TauE/SafE